MITLVIYLIFPTLKTITPTLCFLSMHLVRLYDIHDVNHVYFGCTYSCEKPIVYESASSCDKLIYLKVLLKVVEKVLCEYFYRFWF